jgi:fucose 4-O-acetylase-like acetyltransferase
MVTLAAMATSAPPSASRAPDRHADWVDHAKAIGVVLVVYGHIARGVFNAGIPFPPDLFRLTDSVLYTFHMPLFFFLSGLFFQSSLRRHGAGGMISSKIGTLLWPYLVWSLLQGAIEVLLSSHTNHPITWHEVLALWDPRAQFWFLMALFIVFVVATLLHAALPSLATGILLVGGALAHVLAPASTHESLQAHLADNTVFFALGIVFAWPRGEAIGRVGRLGSLPVILVFAAAFVLSQQVFHVRLGLRWTDTGVATLAVGVTSILAVVALAVGVSRWGGLLAQVSGAIGRASMAIYLMHILAGAGMRIALKPLLGFGSAPVYLAAGTLAGVVLPLIAKAVIDRLGVPGLFSAPRLSRRPPVAIASAASAGQAG